MKTVLAFGDSLTWGLIPGTRKRYPRHKRWPKVLEARLSPQIEVIENGLNMRSTVHDNPFRDYRSGLDVLPVLLEAHAPLDLVLLMLGTNDFHSNFGLKPINVARGMRRLVQVVKTYHTEPDMPVPEVMVISPPRIVEGTDHYYSKMMAGVPEIFEELAPYYQALCEEEGAHFFNAADVASGSPLDGVHLSANDTIRLGEAFVSPVARILNLQE